MNVSEATAVFAVVAALNGERDLKDGAERFAWLTERAHAVLSAGQVLSVDEAAQLLVRDLYVAAQSSNRGADR